MAGDERKALYEARELIRHTASDIENVVAQLQTYIKLLRDEANVSDGGETGHEPEPG